MSDDSTEVLDSKIGLLVMQCMLNFKGRSKFGYPCENLGAGPKFKETTVIKKRLKMNGFAVFHKNFHSVVERIEVS
jgi:hypothetical protein